MSKRAALIKRAEEAGLTVNTWAPGDGIVRYRFHREEKGYFEDDGIYTALGSKEAGVWLLGYIAGRAK